MIERIKKLEKAVQHLNRRAPNRVLAVAPPTVVSFYIPQATEDGLVCTFVCPFRATVKKIAFSSGDIQIAKGMEATVTHVGKAISSMTIPIKFHRFVEETSYQVGAGDTIALQITNPDMIKQISVSLVLEADIDSQRQIKVELNKLLEDADAGV